MPSSRLRGWGPRRTAGLAALASLILPVGPAAADLDEIKARGTLRVLAVPRPDLLDEFFALAPGAGEAPGFDREILEDFARSQGVRLEAVSVPTWDGLLPALERGEGDVAAGRYSATPARRARIDFSERVFPTRNLVVTRRPTPAVHTLEELRRLKVGTIRGTTLAESVAQLGLPRDKLDDRVPVGQLISSLRAGRVQAIVFGIEGFITERRRDAQLEAGLFVGAAGQLAYGVRRGEPHLLAALNLHLQALRASPAWGRLLIKYFGPDAPALLARALEEQP